MELGVLSPTEFVISCLLVHTPFLREKKNKIDLHLTQIVTMLFDPISWSEGEGEMKE